MQDCASALEHFICADELQIEEERNPNEPCLAHQNLGLLYRYRGCH
jgi:hypothetical protein